MAKRGSGKGGGVDMLNGRGRMGEKYGSELKCSCENDVLFSECERSVQ